LTTAPLLEARGEKGERIVKEEGEKVFLHIVVLRGKKRDVVRVCDALPYISLMKPRREKIDSERKGEEKRGR